MGCTYNMSLIERMMPNELDRTYDADEIGHFRAFCLTYLRDVTHGIVSVVFGSTDESERFVIGAVRTSVLLPQRRIVGSYSAAQSARSGHAAG